MPEAPCGQIGPGAEACSDTAPPVKRPNKQLPNITFFTNFLLRLFLFFFILFFLSLEISHIVFYMSSIFFKISTINSATENF
jgi:hypothetical protein